LHGSNRVGIVAWSSRPRQASRRVAKRDGSVRRKVLLRFPPWRRSQRPPNRPYATGRVDSQFSSAVLDSIDRRGLRLLLFRVVGRRDKIDYPADPFGVVSDFWQLDMV